MDRKVTSFRASGQGKACELYAGMKQRREKKGSIIFGLKDRIRDKITTAICNKEYFQLKI